jgi:hypothetical protein
MPKITAKAKRQAVVKAFGNIGSDDSHLLNWLYARRHLAKVRFGKWRDLKYGIEEEELLQTVRKGLDRIRERDGVKFSKEVAERLARAFDMAR